MRVFLFRSFRWRKIFKYAALAVVLAILVLIGTVAATLTLDLGPTARTYAERAGSNYLKRPVHIGRLAIHVARGRVLVEDVSIGGLHAEDRPFFTASRISVSLDWARAFRRRPDFVITSAELADWQMLVEKWSDSHNFPKFTSDTPSSGPRPFVITLKYLRAWRGQFAYEDHEAPWSVVAPNIDINIRNAPNYNGEATFNGGLVRIQEYVPMWAGMKAHFVIDGSRLHLDRIEFETDGAKSAASGHIDLAHWPEQTYAVKSRVDFQRMREIFFKEQPWPLAGRGDFTGTFHLFRGGHDLGGTFASDQLGVYAYRFPALYGSLAG